MNELYRQFGSIIGYVLGVCILPESDYQWDKLIPLFDRHNLTPLAGAAITDCGIDSELAEAVKNKSLKMLSIHINQQHEIEQLSDLFENNGLDVIFLKGSVTCKRYTRPEYRTMGDIDFLYKVAQHKPLKETLINAGYSDYQEGRKNDTFRKPRFTPIEAHRQLVPSDSEFYDWCSKVWDRSILVDGKSHIYQMKLEDEIIFNIIHFAIHFLEGGAGARFLCDVLMYKQQDCDWQYVEKELNELQILDFYKTMAGAADYWFINSEDENELYDRVIDYIMDGGVFGSADNAKTLMVEDGSAKYLKRHFFPSYREMCSLYPWLKGKAILLPFAWVKRGIHTIIHKKGAVRRSISAAQNVDKERMNYIRSLYDDCGLNMRLRQ